MFELVQGDLELDMPLTVADEDGNAVDLTTAESYVLRWLKPDGTLTDVELTAVDLAAGEVKRVWEAGDSDLEGYHRGRVVVTWANGETQSFPEGGAWYYWTVYPLVGHVPGGGAPSELNFAITDGSVTSDKLADANVTAAKLADDAVGTAKIQDGAVTLAKLAISQSAGILGAVAADSNPLYLTSAQATALLDAFVGALKGLVPASDGLNTTTEFLRKDGSWAVPPAGEASVPYVDLSAAPYNVVAGAVDFAQALANVQAINAAIDAFSGTGARLVLPAGKIYVEADEAKGANCCVKFAPGVSKLTLCGQGMFVTELVQFCEGDGGELNLVVIDGASEIHFENMGFSQDTILNRDVGSQNHLLCIYNHQVGGTTREIYGSRLYFGKCMGDAIRLLAGVVGQKIYNVRFNDFVMKLNGTVTSDPVNTLIGARSGIALQRGPVDCEFSNFYAYGAKNSLIDEEPSGGASERVTYRDFVIDNTAGATATAMSLGGTGTAVAYDGRVINGFIRGGSLTALGSTHGLRLQNVTVETTAAMAGAPTQALVLFRSAGGGAGHVDLELLDVTIKRTGTSGAGACFDIIQTGNRMTIRNMHIVQGTDWYPFLAEAAGIIDVDGYRCQFDGATPALRFGISFTAHTNDIPSLRLANLHIRSSTGKLYAACRLLTRTGKEMSKVKVRDIRSAGYATRGVYMTVQGSTMDPTPELSGIDNGTDVPWTQVDEGDNTITTLFPLIAGNRNDIAQYIGDATPEGVLAAKQGSSCIVRAGDSTARYLKSTGTGNTGWVLD